MIFPRRFELSILSEDKKQGMLDDIIVSITLFASKKNDYHLGPFFSNDCGVVKITENQLIFSALSVLNASVMDYCNYLDCSKRVMIEILDSNKLNMLYKARDMWGVTREEEHLNYGSKEALLKKIKRSRNHLVKPKEIYIEFSGQSILKAEIITELLEK